RDTHLDDAERLAERVRKEIENLETAAVEGGAPVRVTASFGVASLPECAEDEQGLVAAADRALLQAKRAGKNRTMRAIACARTQ
ncbi:MAG TPA: diguanylate cyclase, partial [Solirubrobacteraceae bacterium]|nr:diguanylate cyclase [Solirubrobacteraceae bacterium]